MNLNFRFHFRLRIKKNNQRIKKKLYLITMVILRKINDLSGKSSSVVYDVSENSFFFQKQQKLYLLIKIVFNFPIIYQNKLLSKVLSKLFTGYLVLLFVFAAFNVIVYEGAYHLRIVKWIFILWTIDIIGIIVLIYLEQG